MKKLLILVSLTVFSFSNAIAVTLYDALNQTYQNNIQLNAERENIKASEEDINISKADYKPTITLSGSKSLENTNKLTNQSGGNATINDADPFTTSIKLEQTLLDYGRDLTLEKNITALDLAKARLIKKEQDVLHSAIDAYTNLILAREKQDINRKNLNLLRRQVENDKIRRDRGQITNTDLAQSESSLAGAQAQFTQAKSDLLIAKLTYENIIGKIADPNQLKKNSNSIVNIPNSLSDAINLDSSPFFASIISLNFLSSSSYRSASCVIFSISSFVSLDLSFVIVTLLDFPVDFSTADTFKIPFASISKLTSICGIPLGIGGISLSVNSPSL